MGGVSIFGIAAAIVLPVLYIRRLFVGGELGGPMVSKITSFFFMILLWLWFLGLFIWNLQTDATISRQIFVISLSLLGVMIATGIFAAIAFLLRTFLEPTVSQPNLCIHTPVETAKLSS